MFVIDIAVFPLTDDLPLILPNVNALHRMLWEEAERWWSKYNAYNALVALNSLKAEMPG